MGAWGVEPPIALSFFDHTIGKIVSLRLGADGEPLSPAEQRSQIKRPLVLVKAAEWFFAQQSPGFKRPRQRTLPPPGFIVADHSPAVQVRFMFGCVATAYHRLTTAPANMHVTDRTMWRWAQCVMDRVTQGRVRKVQVWQQLRHAVMCAVRSCVSCASYCMSCLFETRCRKRWLNYRCNASAEPSRASPHISLPTPCLQAAAAVRVGDDSSIFGAFVGTANCFTLNRAMVFYHLIADADSAKRENWSK